LFGGFDLAVQHEGGYVGKELHEVPLHKISGAETANGNTFPEQ
jgi:hypothetical protein